MNAIIISIGNELTTGQTVDTNSAYLAAGLAEHGIAANEHWTIADDRGAISAAFRRAAEAADVVLVTGGLGPTQDDLTRQGLADAMGSSLVLDEKCLARIEEFFRRRNRPMNEANRVQAMIPAGAMPLENRLGTAPGLAARLGKANIFVTPGVPWEMKWIFENRIAPQLPPGQGVIVHRIIHTFGLGESDVGAMIADLMRRGANPLVGTTVAAGMVSIRIISEAKDRDIARRQAGDVIQELKRRLGDLVVGEEDQTMASVVGEMLRHRKQTVATAESCTGGMVGQTLTSIAGASDYYLGGVVAYANQAKAGLLDVPRELIALHGAVSEPVARAMAEGCRKHFASDWAISVTGIAGPGGGSEQKPIGLVYVGLAGPSGTQSHRHILPGTRDIVRLRATLTALDHLRLELMRQGPGNRE